MKLVLRTAGEITVKAVRLLPYGEALIEDPDCISQLETITGRPIHDAIISWYEDLWYVIANLQYTDESFEDDSIALEIENHNIIID